PGPIATPSLPSIDAALEPDTKDKYIYFLAIPDGGGRHVFAKTKPEHDANRAKYGYQCPAGDGRGRLARVGRLRQSRDPGRPRPLGGERPSLATGPARPLARPIRPGGR